MALALDTASAFPLTVTHVNSDSSTTLQKTGVTTSGNVMVVVVAAAMTGASGFPLSLSTPTGISAWTLVQNQGPTTGTRANVQGVYIWYAFSSGGLSGQTITCTANGGAFFQGGALTIYSYTGASSTIGNSTGLFFNDGTTGHPLAVTLSAASAGSALVCGTTDDGNGTQTTSANSTKDGNVVDPVFVSSATYHLTALTSAPGNVTYGSSDSTSGGDPNFTTAGVEILAAAGAVDNPPPPPRPYAPRSLWHPNPVSRFRSKPLGDPVPPTPDNPPADPRPRGPFRRGGPNPVGRFRSIRFIEPPAGAGTTFSQSLGGTLSTSGSLILQTGKALGGTLASSGSLLKLVAKVLAGTLTSSGALLKQLQRALTGALSSSGTLLKLIGKLLGGTLTSSGAVTVIKVALRSFGGTLSMSGNLLKQVQKPLGGTMASAGALLRQTQKAFGGTLSSSGSVVKQVGKLLTGTLTSSGALVVVKVVLKSFAGTLSMSGTLTRQTGKALAGSLSSSGGIVRRISKGVAGVLAPAGTLTKRIARTFSGALSFLGSLVVSFRPPNVDNILDPVVLLQAARGAVVLKPATRDPVVLVQPARAAAVVAVIARDPVVLTQPARDPIVLKTRS